jgi:hypothetical protein
MHAVAHLAVGALFLISVFFNWKIFSVEKEPRFELRLFNILFRFSQSLWLTTTVRFVWLLGEGVYVPYAIVGSALRFRYPLGKLFIQITWA